MATVKRFEDLKIWQLARVYSKKIFEIANKESFKNDFDLINQIRSSSGSVMHNIAEGFEREGSNEFRQFLSVAKASLGESKSQIYCAYDRKYISEDIFNQLINENASLSKKIFNTMEYLNETDFRGYKYKSQVNEPLPEYNNE